MAATWATTNDLRAWMDLPEGAGDDTILQQCLDVAQAQQEQALDLERLLAATGDAAVAPVEVKQALLMRANALYRRRQTPEGVSGVGDFAVVRVGRADPDVLRMEGPWRKYGFR